MPPFTTPSLPSYSQRSEPAFFTKLPGEIRERIYHFAFTSTVTTYFTECKPGFPQSTGFSECNELFPIDPFKVNKKFYQEAFPYFLRHSRFVLTIIALYKSSIVLHAANYMKAMEQGRLQLYIPTKHLRVFAKVRHVDFEVRRVELSHGPTEYPLHQYLTPMNLPMNQQIWSLHSTLNTITLIKVAWDTTPGFISKMILPQQTKGLRSVQRQPSSASHLHFEALSQEGDGVYFEKTRRECLVTQALADFLRALVRPDCVVQVFE